METKQINGKAIYSPNGKAGEYAKYAVNFYNGCSNDCSYCYCKRGVLGHAMGAPKATIKKTLISKHDAYKIFMKELLENQCTLRKHGLFFSFSTDPLLPDTQELTNNAVLFAVDNGIPCSILTKRADFRILDTFQYYGHLIAYGFTLTGCDELEPNASPNDDRITRMMECHLNHFKTFASIEPVIDLDKSYAMIKKALPYCDLFKIGLLSGKKSYTPGEVQVFMARICLLFKNYGQETGQKIPRIYFKESMYEYSHYKREGFEKDLDFIVQSDYNLFKQN